jgi:hypothetical protein
MTAQQISLRMSPIGASIARFAAIRQLDRVYGSDTDGEKYVGEFKVGLPNGQGSALPDGSKYVGEFKNGRRNGRGTEASPDGRKYVGEFRDYKFDGQGTLYAADGSISSSGIWANGEFMGTVASQELVAMEKEGGVYVVPVRFNGAITLNAIIDSGAADVSIPADIASTLIRTKTLSEQDFLGVQTSLFWNFALRFAIDTAL